MTDAGLRRYVVLAVLQYGEELKKANDKIAELEVKLSHYYCPCGNDFDEDYNNCDYCDNRVCHNCFDQEFHMCSECLEKNTIECYYCMNRTIESDYPSCEICNQDVCNGCMVTDHGICLDCADIMCEGHPDAECDGCGEEICVVCLVILKKYSNKQCCDISDTHVHCPHCETYIETE